MMLLTLVGSCQLSCDNPASSGLTTRVVKLYQFEKGVGASNSSPDRIIYDTRYIKHIKNQVEKYHYFLFR